MAEVVVSKKACAENPLKSSAPLGAALAFLGVEGSVPLFHGSQGCTSFALVLAVRHFKEAIPLQTTAMNEASTILGGQDNLEEALLNLQKRMKPRFIGVASTALVETRGEDFAGELKTILAKRRELDGTAVVFASTPDFEGALEEGWSKATAAIVRALVKPAPARASDADAEASRRINVLPGVHQTPADLEELRTIIEAFGLAPTFLPDVSASLDGHVPDQYIGTSLGGARLADIAALGGALHTVAIGEHMRAPAVALEEVAGVPFTLFPTLMGLAPCDRLMALLSSLSGREIPASLRRRRSQLVDAMLDAHFSFGGTRIAVGADPDLLYAVAQLAAGLGAEVVTAVSSTGASPALASVPAARVVVGDLADLETLATAARAQILITHSHGRQAAAKMGVPLFRVGFPIFDRIGSQHRASVGYAGTRAFVVELANTLLATLHEATPTSVLGHDEHDEHDDHHPARPGPLVLGTEEVLHVSG